MGLYGGCRIGGRGAAGRLRPAPHRPARVDARQEPDVWFEPGLVLEILSAELTLSPNYTAELVDLYHGVRRESAQPS